MVSIYGTLSIYLNYRSLRILPGIMFSCSSFNVWYITLCLEFLSTSFFLCVFLFPFFYVCIIINNHILLNNIALFIWCSGSNLENLLSIVLLKLQDNDEIEEKSIIGSLLNVTKVMLLALMLNFDVLIKIINFEKVCKFNLIY